MGNAEAGPSEPHVILASRSRSQKETYGDDLTLSGLTLGGKQEGQEQSLKDRGTGTGTGTGEEAAAGGPAVLARRSKPSPWASSSGSQGKGGVSGVTRGKSAHFPQLGAPVAAGSTAADGAVRDGDEDDWFDAGRPVTNRQIWDTAYVPIYASLQHLFGQAFYHPLHPTH